MNKPCGPPPPPPPISSASANNAAAEKSTILAHSVKLNDEQMKNGLVNLVILEIQRLHKLGGNGKDLGAVIVTNALLQPLLQNGPLCGLVALAMGAQHFNPEQDVNIDLVFGEAKKRGFTKTGEMFSVQNMKNLADDFLKCQSTIVDTRLEDGRILTRLLQGSLALFPYDADFNHGPAQRQGHSAHWCLLSGIVLFVDKTQLEYLSDQRQQTQGDRDEGNTVIFMSPFDIQKNQSKILNELVKTLDKESIYVVSRQGKSKQIGLWNYSELIKSNQNLIQISPKITEKLDDFVIFPIETSLCNQAIILCPN